MVFTKPIFTFARQGFAKVVGGYAQAAKVPTHVPVSSARYHQPSAAGSGRDANQNANNGFQSYSTSAVSSTADDGQNERQWLVTPTAVRRMSFRRSLSVQAGPHGDYSITPPTFTPFSLTSGRGDHDTGREQVQPIVFAQKQSPDDLRRMIEVSWRDRNFSMTANAFAALEARQEPLTIEQGNMVLDALYNLRQWRSARGIDNVLKAFTYILNTGVGIDSKTYYTVIRTLCDREMEVSTEISRIRTKTDRDGHCSESDDVHLQSLQGEKNLVLALEILKTAQAVSPKKVDLASYNLLLKAAAKSQNTEEAFNIVALMEKWEVHPNVDTYQHLMDAFSCKGEIRAVLEVYDEFTSRPSHEPAAHKVYAALIRAYFRAKEPENAVTFLQKLIQSAEPRDLHISIFIAVLEGFAHLQDFEAVVQWTKKMLQDSNLPDPPWSTIARTIPAAVKSSNSYDAISKIYDLVLSHNTLFRGDIRQVFDYLAMVIKEDDLSRAREVWKDMERQQSFDDTFLNLSYAEFLLTRNSVDEAIQCFSGACASQIALAVKPELSLKSRVSEGLGCLISAVDNANALNWARAVTFVRTYRSTQCDPTNTAFETLVRVFDEDIPETVVARDELSEINLVDITHAVAVYYAEYEKCERIAGTLRKFVRFLIARDAAPRSNIRNRIRNSIILTGDVQLTDAWDLQIAEKDRRAEERAASYESYSRPALARTFEDPIIDIPSSQEINRLIMRSHGGSESWMPVYRKATESGRMLTPSLYPEMIIVAGKESNRALVHEIFEEATQLISRFSGETAVLFKQSLFNSMIIAHVSSGDYEMGRRYRSELLAMGSAPNASAFAAYIVNLNGTNFTDEATAAMRIFEEARSLHVTPNAFLFNTLISKLSKARRASEALQYFDEMRNMGIEPTAVTYGTVINACCRTGDEQLATRLFAEMEAALPMKRPRAAPYNSMIQFYIDSKRDRERALYYYRKLRDRKIHPSEHTYRLLINAYASLDPFDIDSADDVISTMQRDGTPVTTRHHAALIHARGCVLHDLDSARGYFQQLIANGVKPDDILYQSLLESYVANHRVEETPAVLQDMRSHGLQLTAYIANTLIHGWSLAGKVQEAEKMFHSLNVNERGLHGREPSTYEAMARAYLSQGNRSGIALLVDEMVGKGYAPAVVAHVKSLTSEEHRPELVK